VKKSERKVYSRGDNNDAEKKLFRLRRKINELYFKQGYSKKAIARRLGVTKKFVIKWTRSIEQDFSMDARGWKMGQGRKWDEAVRQRIESIHESLTKDPLQFYWGATAIDQEWRKRYPGIAAPPVRTIGYILSSLGLSKGKKSKRNKGAARYLCYPEHTIYEGLGYRVLEVDFIGCKFFSGSPRPLNFVGFSFKKDPRLRHFIRVTGETSNSFIGACQYFFKNFEIPGAIKVDNGPAMIGGPPSAKRNVSRSVLFLLQNGVIPIFAVPRRPFSQASIEGNNSVFARKFWNPTYFESVSEVDTKLQWFNDASERYTNYQRPLVARPANTEFVPKVFFIRQVKEGSSSEGIISVLHEDIPVPECFINYFVLAEWNLAKEQLTVSIEKEQKPEVIQTIPFQIDHGYKRPARQRYSSIKKLCEKS
jgi:transposase